MVVFSVDSCRCQLPAAIPDPEEVVRLVRGRAGHDGERRRLDDRWRRLDNDRRLLRLVLRELPDAEVGVVQGGADDIVARAFRRFDSDGSGSIDVEELHSALISLEMGASMDQTREVMLRYDVDRSGTLDWKEIRRALDLWNIPLDHDKLMDLIAACDHDGDGEVDYKEFVDVLARDTVTVAAMGKRDMQAKEAMGVEALDAEFLGHKHAKNIKASLNDFNFDDL